jgi:glucose/arabinose dehydrogenase
LHPAFISVIVSGMIKPLAIAALALCLATGCATQNTPTSPPLVPASQKAAPTPRASFIIRTAGSTWQTITKPVAWIIPPKTDAATEPATQPAAPPDQAIIVVPTRNNPSVSPMRMPLPPDDSEN